MPDWAIYLVVLLVSTVISVALQPKPQAPKAALLEDFEIPTAEQGRPIPVVFGTKRVTGPNVLDYGGLTTEAIRKKSGKK